MVVCAALLPALAFTPTAALAAIIVSVIGRLVEVRCRVSALCVARAARHAAAPLCRGGEQVGEFVRMWRTDRRDFLVAFATCAIIAFDSITHGILAGVVIQAVSSYTRGFALRSKVEALTLVSGKTGAHWEPIPPHCSTASEGAMTPILVVDNPDGSTTNSRSDLAPAKPVHDAVASASPIAVVLRFVGPDLQFAHAERVHSHFGEAQGMFTPRVFIVDCRALAAVDYSGACALLAAAEDVASGVAAELVGDSGGDPKPRCLVFFADVSEDGDGALGPFIRRCGAAIGARVHAPGTTATGALWSVGAVEACVDVPAALSEAAARYRALQSVAVNAGPTIIDNSGEIGATAVAPPPAAEKSTTAEAAVAAGVGASSAPDILSLAVPLATSIRASASSEEVLVVASPPVRAVPADAVEGIPTSPLLSLWLHQRRAKESGAPFPPSAAGEATASGSARSLARLVWTAAASVRDFYRAVVGDVDPAEPLLRMQKCGSLSKQRRDHSDNNAVRTDHAIEDDAAAGSTTELPRSVVTEQMATSAQSSYH